MPSGTLWGSGRSSTVNLHRHGTTHTIPPQLWNKNTVKSRLMTLQIVNYMVKWFVGLFLGYLKLLVPSRVVKSDPKFIIAVLPSFNLNSWYSRCLFRFSFLEEILGGFFTLLLIFLLFGTSLHDWCSDADSRSLLRGHVLRLGLLLDAHTTCRCSTPWTAPSSLGRPPSHVVVQAGSRLFLWNE